MLKAKKIAQDELNASLAEQASVLETDTLELRKLETAVANGATYEEAFASSIKNASTAAKEHAIQTKGASGSTDVFVSKQRSAQASLRATATASKTASVAMRALSMAMNMIVIGLITKGLELLGSAISNYIHRVEKANEKIEESRSSYEDAKSSIESMNDELKTTQDKIDDLQSKGTLSFTDKAELDNLKAQNDELERSISLEEKKKQNAASQTVNDIKQNKDTLSDDFEESIKNLSEYQEEYEHMKQVGIKGISDETVTPENYEVTMTAMDKNMDLYEKHVLENIEKFEKYKVDIINKYNTDDVSQFSQSDRDLYNSIVSQLQKAYKTIYSDSDYNKFVIEPIFNQDKLKGLQDQLLQYFVNGGSTDTSALEEKFGADIITALRNACEKAGIDFDKMIEDMYRNSQSKLDHIAPMIEAPNGAEDAKQNQVSKKIRDYIQNDLSEEDRTILLNAEIPDDVKFKTKQDVDNFIGSLNKEADTSKETISFKDAWSGLEKGKDELVKLAEAGRLTANDLKGLEGGKTLMEKTGLSAEQLAEKINKLTDSATQLSSMSAQISKMSDMLADKKNGTTASASDLAGFDASVKGLDSWEQFEKVMGDSKSSIKDCQKAANALATEWVNNSNFLENLTEDNQSYYVTQLKAMGVENAEAIVTDTLAQKKNELAIQEEYEIACKEAGITASADLATVTGTEIQALLDEGTISSDTATKLANLVVKKRLANGVKLSTAGDIRNLADLAGAATTLGRLLNSLADVKQGFTNGMPSDIAAKQIESYEKQINALVNGGNNANISEVDISPSGSKEYTVPKKSKGSSSTKDSKQEINWIDRKLSVLQSKIDLTKSKFDNLFNLTSPKNLKKNIDRITKSLSSAQSKADSFKKKMSVVKLDDSTKKKVQKGTVKLSDYSKNDQKRIKQYQKYYSSYEKYATKVKNLQKQLNTLNSSRGKINNLETQIKQMKALESATSKAIKKYESYAGKVGLSKSLRNKVKNGDYNITDYGSKTQAKIQKYQDYIDKIAELRQQLQEIQGDIRDTKIQEYQLRADDADAKRSKSESWTDLERVDNYKKINSHLEYQKKQVKESYKWQIKIAEAEGDSTKASQLRAEREKELRNLTKQEFDAIASAYDYQLKLNDAKRQGVQDALSLAESRGDQIGSAYYSSQISVNNADLNTRYEERERLLKKLSTMKKGSEEWYDSYDTLQGVNKEISSLINNNAELDRKIKQLKWDRFDELKNKIDDVITEASFLSDLLDSDNFFDDKGMITNDGVTAMGLALQNYDSYLAEAQKYGEQLAELEANKNNLSYDDYTSKLREYTQGQQNAIKSANDLKKTTISYVKQGLDAQNEALSKEIEQRKKLLEQAKTERDFNDKTLDQNKKIARLKRQIAILENDDSDSNRKTLRELRSQLQDVEKEQSDSFYDKSVSDQEDALDNMLENSKKQAEEYLKDTDKVFADAIVYVNAHADQVSTTLTKLAQDTGYNISEYITKAWRGSGNAVGDYASTMSKNVPKITQQIALITGAWEAQCLAADRAAEASAKAAQGFYSNGSGSGSGNTNNTNNSNSNDDSAEDIKKYITDHADKAKHKKSYYDTLNRYLYEKTGGKVLSVIEEVQLAKMLGVSVKKDLSGTLDRQKILNALKKKNIKFANGGILGDLVKVSGEDGLFIGSAGESVLTKEQTQALINFRPVIPQLNTMVDLMKNVPISSASQSPTYNIDNRTIVEGIATDQIVKQMEGVAQKQAENVVRKINSATYAKGVRR